MFPLTSFYIALCAILTAETLQEVVCASKVAIYTRAALKAGLTKRDLWAELSSNPNPLTYSQEELLYFARTIPPYVVAEIREALGKRGPIH